MSPITATALLLFQAAETEEVLSGVQEVVSREGMAPFIRAALLVVVGFPLLMGVSRWLRGWVSRTYDQQQGLIAGKLLFYAGAAVILVSVLNELGFGVAPLLGAAGILGIALGFASQTSVSNIISGVFLMAEQPFVVDDVIQVGQTVGRVLSVDTLSVKLRTFDNKFVRIPNESIIKTEVTNITRFPVRRVDVLVGVAYKEDVARVREVLTEVAAKNPLCLMEPEPVIIFDGYGESSLNFSFRVWATRENWLNLKNTIHEEVKDRFDQEGIEIPFPHRTLYVGSVTDPFPVEIRDARDGNRDGSAGGEAKGDGEGLTDAPPAGGIEEGASSQS